MNAAATAAEKVHQSDGLDHAVRIGLIAYGIVHLLVAWLALQLAFGDKEGQASNGGALSYLAEQPLGGFLVWGFADWIIGTARSVRGVEANAPANTLDWARFDKVWLV